MRAPADEAHGCVAQANGHKCATVRKGATGSQPGEGREGRGGK
eukprot:SAG11_NODE_11229_length_775_cov_0.986686_1_plen_42_part_01